MKHLALLSLLALTACPTPTSIEMSGPKNVRVGVPSTFGLTVFNASGQPYPSGDATLRVNESRLAEITSREGGTDESPRTAFTLTGREIGKTTLVATIGDLKKELAIDVVDPIIARWRVTEFAVVESDPEGPGALRWWPDYYARGRLHTFNYKREDPPLWSTSGFVVDVTQRADGTIRALLTDMSGLDVHNAVVHVDSFKLNGVLRTHVTPSVATPSGPIPGTDSGNWYDVEKALRGCFEDAASNTFAVLWNIKPGDAAGTYSAAGNVGWDWMPTKTTGCFNEDSGENRIYALKLSADGRTLTGEADVGIDVYGTKARARLVAELIDP